MQTGSVQFRITDAAKRVIDPTVNFHFKDGTTTVAYTSISSLDYLNGEVVFTAPLAAAASLSFSGNYLPITTSSDTLLEATSFKISQSRDLLDRTVFAGTTGGNGPFRGRLAGLQDFSLDVTSIALPADLATLASVQFAGNPVVVEVFFADVANVRFRGFCVISDISRDDSVDGKLVTNLSFKASAILNETANQVAGFTFKVQP